MDQVYLIFCRRYVNGFAFDSLETLFSSMDGAKEQMERIKTHFRHEKGFRVEEVPDGSFYVDGPNGFQRLYYVSMRTIEK